MPKVIPKVKGSTMVAVRSLSCSFFQRTLFAINWLHCGSVRAQLLSGTDGYCNMRSISANAPNAPDGCMRFCREGHFLRTDETAGNVRALTLGVIWVIWVVGVTPGEVFEFEVARPTEESVHGVRGAEVGNAQAGSKLPKRVDRSSAFNRLLSSLAANARANGSSGTRGASKGSSW